jgi:hypothetical protein
MMWGEAAVTRRQRRDDTVFAAASRLLSAALMVFALGCTGKPPATGKPVKGTVTYSGSPVEGASVSFISSTVSGYGSTDTEGHFTLRTGQGEGLPVGDYQVTVTKTELPPTGKVATSDQDYVPPDPDAPPAVAKDLLPAKYQTTASSDLKASVTASGPNDFTFPLTD